MSWKEIMEFYKPNNSFADIANTFQGNKNKNLIMGDKDNSDSNPIIKNNKERKKVKNDIYTGYPQYPQKPKTKTVCSDFYPQYPQNPNIITLDVFDCLSCKYKAVYTERDVRCAYELLTTGKAVKPQNLYKCPLNEQ